MPVLHYQGEQFFSPKRIRHQLNSLRPKLSRDVRSIRYDGRVDGQFHYALTLAGPLSYSLALSRKELFPEEYPLVLAPGPPPQEGAKRTLRQQVTTFPHLSPPLAFPLPFVLPSLPLPAPPNDRYPGISGAARVDEPGSPRCPSLPATLDKERYLQIQRHGERMGQRQTETDRERKRERRSHSWTERQREKEKQRQKKGQRSGRHGDSQIERERDRIRERQN